MPVAKQDRRSERIHHEEHEGHEEWDSSASSSDSSEGVVNRTGYYTPQVLFVSFVVKQICAFSRCSRTQQALGVRVSIGRPLKSSIRMQKNIGQ